MWALTSSHSEVEKPVRRCHHERPIKKSVPWGEPTRTWRTINSSLAIPCSTTKLRMPIPPKSGQPKTISREIFRLKPRRASVARTAGFCRVVSCAVVKDVTGKVNVRAGEKHKKYANHTPYLLRSLLKRRREYAVTCFCRVSRYVCIDKDGEFQRPR
jgi:hypothetical protein